MSPIINGKSCPPPPPLSVPEKRSVYKFNVHKKSFDQDLAVADQDLMKGWA